MRAEEIDRAMQVLRARCAEREVPLHADALAAELQVSYDRLLETAEGKGVPATVAARMTAALQECTASVLDFSLAPGNKHDSMMMFYLKNRAGFSDKTDKRSSGTIVFAGESEL